MGNHETMMRLALDPETPWDVAIDAFETWFANGGDRTVARVPRSVGARQTISPSCSTAGARVAAASRACLALVAAAKLALGRRFCSFTPESTRVSSSRPFLPQPWNIPLATLDEDRHWAWVRWPFLEHRPGPEGFSGYFVVHGHTPNDARRDASHADQIAGFRLNLDAGSAMTGVAKMAVIRDRQAEVISARGSADWGA